VFCSLWSFTNGYTLSDTGASLVVIAPEEYATASSGWIGRLVPTHIAVRLFACRKGVNHAYMTSNLPMPFPG
jgi:hypothetical protein